MGKVLLCEVAAAPAEGELREFSVGGRQLCVANDRGRLAAIDNICPHRQGPLSEGILENGHVLCPWHAWTFNLETGKTSHAETASVNVYPLVSEGESLWVLIPD